MPADSAPAPAGPEVALDGAVERSRSTTRRTASASCGCACAVAASRSPSSGRCRPPSPASCCRCAAAGRPIRGTAPSSAHHRRGPPPQRRRRHRALPRLRAGPADRPGPGETDRRDVRRADPGRAGRHPGAGPRGAGDRAAARPRDRGGLGRAPRAARRDGVPGRARAGHALRAPAAGRLRHRRAAHPQRQPVSPGRGRARAGLPPRPTGSARIAASATRPRPGSRRPSRRRCCAAGQNGHTRLAPRRAGRGRRRPGRGRRRTWPRAAIAQLLAGGTIAVATEQPTAAAPSPARETAACSPAALAAAPERRRSAVASPAPRVGTGRARVRIYDAGRLPQRPRRPTMPMPTGSASGWPGWCEPRRTWPADCSGWPRRPGLPARRVERWLAADGEARGLSDEQRQPSPPPRPAAASC